MENPFESINLKLDNITNLVKDLSKMKNDPNKKEWGGVDFAEEITGYSKSTLYIKSSRNEIPHIKRDGKLWFEKTALLQWIEDGKVKRLDQI